MSHIHIKNKSGFKSIVIYIVTFTLNCSNLLKMELSMTSAPLYASTSSFRTLYSSLAPSEVMTMDVSVTAVTLPTGYMSLVLIPL